jgi:hypothetical protein
MEAAKQFNSRVAFRNGAVAAAAAATRSEWGFYHFCEHMTGGERRWTYEKILHEALKYKTKREFREADRGAYAAAERTGRMSELCAHMKRSVVKRMRYIYRISDDVRKIGYVGLAVRPAERYRRHRRSGTRSVRDLIAGPHAFEVIHGPVEESEAQALEAMEIKRLRDSGYNALNKVKAGGLGSLGGVKWSKDAIIAEARKYKTRKEFSIGAPGAYGAAARYFGLDNICPFLRPALKSWDAESIRVEALKYSTRTVFENACGSAVNAARRLGIMDEVCAHMPIYRGGGKYVNNNNNISERAG